MIKAYIQSIANGKLTCSVGFYPEDSTVEECVMYSVKDLPGITGMLEKGWNVNGVYLTDMHRKISEFCINDCNEIYITHHSKMGGPVESFYGEYYEATKHFNGFDDVIRWPKGNEK